MSILWNTNRRTTLFDSYYKLIVFNDHDNKKIDRSKERMF